MHFLKYQAAISGSVLVGWWICQKSPMKKLSSDYRAKVLLKIHFIFLKKVLTKPVLLGTGKEQGRYERVLGCLQSCKNTRKKMFTLGNVKGFINVHAK